MRGLGDMRRMTVRFKRSWTHVRRALRSRCITEGLREMICRLGRVQDGARVGEERANAQRYALTPGIWRTRSSPALLLAIALLP